MTEIISRFGRRLLGYWEDEILKGPTPVLPPIIANLMFWLELNEDTSGLGVDQVPTFVDAHGNYNFVGQMAAGATYPTNVVTATSVLGRHAESHVTNQRHFRNTSNDLATQRQSWAICGWGFVKPTFPNALTVTRRWYTAGGNSANRDFEILLVPSIDVVQLLYGASKIDLVVAAGTIPTNQWFFVAASWDRAALGLRLQINNTVYTTTVALPALPGVESSFVFGGIDGGPNSTFVTAGFDNWAYWKGYIPTADELAWIRNAGAGRSYADFIAQYG